MILSLRDLPILRWLRYAALAALAFLMFYGAASSDEWREARQVTAFAYPVGFLVNALSIEILFARIRRRRR